MKSKESPNLYEILKSANGEPASAIPETVAPRPVTRSAPVPAPGIDPPAPAASKPEPAVVEAASSGPGERVLQLSTNSAIFLGLIAVALLFVAYAVGLHMGRSAGSEEMTAEPPADPGPVETAPETPASPGKVWTIRLIEWPAQSAKERMTALSNAKTLGTYLEGNGYKATRYATVTRNGSARIVLYWGRFDSRTSAEPTAVLQALRRLKHKSKEVFAKADFEEVTP